MWFSVVLLLPISVATGELVLDSFHLRQVAMTDLQQPICGFSARGRIFTSEDIEAIIGIVEGGYEQGRTAISKEVCRALSWLQPNGRLKDVACREALRKLQALGLISLPSPRTHGGVWNADLDHRNCKVDMTPVSDANLRSVSLRIVRNQADVLLWNSLVGTHHYLHSSRIVGRQIKYLAYADERPVACLGWGDAAWALNSRDGWIGWSCADRVRNRHLVVNNVRFLILPWVHVPNLASYLLGACCGRIVQDWYSKYGTRPVLLETFVDTSRFPGTCYRAANWIQVGLTSGYAKMGDSHHNSQTPKGVFLYPVHDRCKDILKGSSLND